MDLATATDLVRWAEFRDAQARFPQLVRRLIAETADGLSRLRVRAGEGVALRGWDGITEAARNSTFVPAGLAVWEMGVGDPRAKATEDYRKRTEQPGDVDPATAAFVFVALQRWSSKEDWVNERRQEGVWNEVAAYDADDLETWLEAAPATHTWISSLLGKDPYEAESLEAWWDSWSSATRPALPASLLLSGRQREVEQLRAILRGEPSTTSVAADSESEALAFVAATLLTEDTAALIERALIIRTPRAWRRLSVSQAQLVLLPIFEQPVTAPAIRTGHHVVLPLGREIPTVRGISLPRLRRVGIEVALMEAGLHRDRASSLATLGRGSLLSLRRTLAVNPDFETPQWAHPQHASDIVPAVLAGSWDDSSQGDREAIANIAGRSYEEVARVLTRWIHTSHPPVRRIGDVWLVAAKADAWSLTARSLTTDDLDRFRQQAIEVLGADDPALDLPRDQRFIASVLGQKRRHSQHLVRGIADTLALMAASAVDVQLAGDRRGDVEAAIVTRSLLEAANADPIGRRWHTLAAVLPLLAEAAPTAFLQAVETGSRTEAGPVLQLFQDGDQSSFFSSGSPHSSLLWALETLAWSPHYLPRAALCLAVLARLDPGGRTLNRPCNSLRDILLLWRPGTAATLEQRIEVVDLLRLRENDVAWALMLQLLPADRESASPTSSPRYREWRSDDAGVVTTAEHFRATESLVERALADTGIDGGRWAALLKRIASSGLPARDRVVGGLEGLDPSTLNTDDRRILYRALRELVNRHRQYVDAAWSMPAAILDRLDALIPAFEPRNPFAKHGWLFEARALDAFVHEDRQERYRLRDEAQDAAIQELIADAGLRGVADWAATLPDPQFSGLQIGETLARSEEIEPNEVLMWLNSEREMDRRIAVHYVAHLRRTQGLSWAEELFRDYGSSWPPAQQALFLHGLGASPDVWTLAESLGPETERLYWSLVNPYSLPSEPDFARRAAEKLMAAGQHRSTLHLLAMVGGREPDGVPQEILADALEGTVRLATSLFDSTLVHIIGEHLDRLDDAGFDRDRLAQLEWGFLPVFRLENRRSRILHSTLAEDPAFFANVVSLAYRAPGEAPRELSNFEQAQARSAHDLLDSWRLVPGTRADGMIDGGHLREWVRDARNRLADSGRVEMGERAIGRVLRYGPPPQPAPTIANSTPEEGNDHEPPHVNWPAEPIRDVIEFAASQHIELGFQAEVFYSRGATVRGLTEGGQQERELAERYRQHAEFVRLHWPRTAAMLAGIAESYEADAEHYDRDADLTEDTWP